MATTHPFTCNTCQVAFRGSDLQRTHMQSDWHRYNLKRRVASLPPLTSEVFAEKVLANKASAAATAARASFQRQCEACDKTYFSEGAYVNHLGSQKHKLAVAKASRRGENGTDTESMVGSTLSLGEPVELASTQDGENEASDGDLDAVVADMSRTQLNGPSQDEQEATKSESASESDDYEHTADPSQCLFCNYISDSMENNANHMNRQHGFFVPEREYLVDMSGLITHLSETIQVLNQCLFCHKAAHTPAGAQTHMRDRGHCMMAYSTEDEQLDVGDFYDFRATYSDEESESDEDESEAPAAGLGAKRAVKTVVQNEDGEDEVMSEDDEEWESGSEASSVPTDEITSVPVDPKPPKKDRLRHGNRPHKANDGTSAAYFDDYELHLPSGRTAGHRSLRQYYKQNLRNFQGDDDLREQRLLQDSERTTQDRGRGRQVATRADGGLGMIGVSEAKKREIRVVEKRQEKRAQRAEARYQWGNNKRANHQKHFRDHLLQ